MAAKKSVNLPAIVGGEPNELKERARQLYFSRCPTNSISRDLKISTSTLGRWRTEGNWEIERENADRSIVEDAFSVRRTSIARITRITSEQIERGLKAVSDRFEPPSLREVEALANILASLDKIARLDNNKSTENVSVQIGVNSMTVEKIRELVMSDPFIPKKDEGHGPV